jgi:IPT/TIG domain-containing protein
MSADNPQNRTPATEPGKTPDSGPIRPETWQVGLLAIYLILVAILLADALTVLWPTYSPPSSSSAPTVETGTGQGATTEQNKQNAPAAEPRSWNKSVRWWPFTTHTNIPDETRLLLIVIFAGALGSFVHAATSFVDFAGNRRLNTSWFWWYALRPFIGMALALVFYFVVSGGLLSTGNNADKVNPFGIAALAGLVGMFAKQATDKLDETFTTLFRSAKGDDKRKDDLENPKANIAAVDPATLEAGETGTPVTLKGSGFVRGSVARVNEKNRDTTFVSERELRVDLMPGDISNEGEITVTVFNPEPGGGISEPIKVKVQKPQAPLRPPADVAPDQAPTLSAINPSQVPANTDVNITVTGSNFVDGAKVQVGDKDVETGFVSATELSAKVKGTDIPDQGSLNVTVTNPPPRGGKSKAVTLEVGPVV